jgi:uncharacterized protein (TIGR00297 family)
MMLAIVELGGSVAMLPVVPSNPQIWIALAVTIIFAVIARWLNGVSFSGAIAGAAVCFLLYIGGGFGAFLALVTVFGLTWVTTRLGYRRKQTLGTAEPREGRKASQVLANLAGAAGAAGFFVWTGNALFLLAAAAALSEAAADTVSSELGQVGSDTARLITSWKEVPAGTDGGVTWNGTLAGIASAVLVSLVSALTGLLPWRWFGFSIAGATAGMIADSFLGAVLEQRRLLNNDGVNFLGTLTAAVVAFLLAR